MWCTLDALFCSAIKQILMGIPSFQCHQDINLPGEACISRHGSDAVPEISVLSYRFLNEFSSSFCVVVRLGGTRASCSTGAAKRCSKALVCNLLYLHWINFGYPLEPKTWIPLMVLPTTFINFHHHFSIFLTVNSPWFWQNPGFVLRSFYGHCTWRWQLFRSFSAPAKLLGYETSTPNLNRSTRVEDQLLTKDWCKKKNDKQLTWQAERIQTPLLLWVAWLSDFSDITLPKAVEARRRSLLSWCSGHCVDLRQRASGTQWIV